MIKKIGNINPSGNGMNGNVFDADYLCPTVTTNKGEGIKILVKEKNIEYAIVQKPRGFNKGGIYEDSPSITKSSWEENNFLIGASRGRDSENPSDRTSGNKNLQQRLEINHKGTSNTITSVQKDNYVVKLPEYSIRKLTPKECWRLMGCSDEDFEKAEQVNSNSQLYKQAGNAIVVDVLESIFGNLFQTGESFSRTY